jgi:cell division protein FtsN
VSAPRRPLSARDYKHGGRHGRLDLRFQQYRQFFIGLAVGLAVALGVFIIDHRPQAAAGDTPPPAVDKKLAATSPEVAPEEPVEEFDFYDMLPNYEVTIPEQERNVQRDLPAVPVAQAGAYVLQVGSFQKEAEAERRRQRLAKLGIESSVQRIAVDTNAWHRVRIGPLRDLPRLNEIRRQLHAADIDALLIRLPD